MFRSARRVARAASAAAIFVLAGGLIPLHSIAQAQQADAPAALATDPGWPRDYTTDQYTFTVFEPQVESWDASVLTGKSAVAVQRAGAASPEYGTITFTARATLNRDTNMVTVDNTQVTQASFPLSADNGAAYLAALRPRLAASQTIVTAGRLQTSLVIARAGKTAPADIDNSPPRIIYSDQPAVLLLIDGAPVLRPAGDSLMRVINTRALLLLDQTSGTYFMRALGTWLAADTIDGPWSTVAVAPDRVQNALAELADQPGIDLLEPADGVRPYDGVRVIVSTTPAELVQTQGRVNFVPISGTRLLYAQNTQSRLYFYLTDQKIYTLISGRWFRTASLANGPWEFIDASALPLDFALIPAEHPTGDTLASVAGTPQAQEAAIANSVPRVAEVDREGLQAAAVYDGEPAFEPIDGTQMQYAVNTTTPVIRLAPTSYYLVDNGVWFTATSASGPWFVCADVPPVIYTIPVRHRLHHVTYVRVYASTPRTVLVGYTPGYYGAELAPSGCVVYGAGYRYNSYSGNFWAPAPVTYGLGASISFGGHSGATLRFGVGGLFGSRWSPDPYSAWRRHVVWRDTPHSRGRDWDYSNHRDDRAGRDWSRGNGHDDSRGHDPGRGGGWDGRGSGGGQGHDRDGGGRGNRDRVSLDENASGRLPDPPAQHQSGAGQPERLIVRPRDGAINNKPDQAVVESTRPRILRGIPSEEKQSAPAVQPQRPIVRQRNTNTTQPMQSPLPLPAPQPQKQQAQPKFAPGPQPIVRPREPAAQYKPRPAPRAEAPPVVRPRTPAPQPAPAPRPAPKAAPRPAPPPAPVVRPRNPAPQPHARSSDDSKSRPVVRPRK